LRGQVAREVTKKVWKKKINDRIQRVGLEIWKAGVVNKRTLASYSWKERPSKERCYNGGWEGELLFKARAGCLEVRARTYRWSGEGDLCGVCRTGERETIEHFIMDCEGYNIERTALLQLAEVALGGEWAMVRGDRQTLLAMLLGLGRGAIAEITEGTKSFLAEGWGVRSRAMERV
jgi:hypothetical protein